MNADAWLTRSLSTIRAIRSKSSRLAKSYYQLARAIEIGRTLGVPEYSDDPNAITMGGLRKQYLDLLVAIAQLDQVESPSSTNVDEDEGGFESSLKRSDVTGQDANGKSQMLSDVDLDSYIEDWVETADYDTDPTPVPVDEFEWKDRTLTLETLRELFAEEISAGARAQAEKVERLKRDTELRAAAFDRKAREEHERSGNVGAGKVDELGVRAGREVVRQGITGDRRVQMIARGTGPRPCAFCAMLSSRGWVYRSEAAAGFSTNGGNDVEKYHPNCHCFPLVRWVTRPDGDLPELSAYFKEMWPKVTRGKSYQTLPDGKVKNNALNAWRRWLYAERKKELDAQRSTPTQA